MGLGFNVCYDLDSGLGGLRKSTLDCTLPSECIDYNFCCETRTCGKAGATGSNIEFDGAVAFDCAANAGANYVINSNFECHTDCSSATCCIQRTC